MSQQQKLFAAHSIFYDVNLTTYDVATTSQQMDFNDQIPMSSDSELESPMTEQEFTEEDFMEVSYIEEVVHPHFDQVIKASDDRTYGIVSMLGEGSFGKAYEVYSFEDRNYYAMKVQDYTSAIQQSRVNRELNNIKTIEQRLPFSLLLPMTVDTFDHEGKKCIVMEKLDEDLNTFLLRVENRSLHPQYLKKIAQQLLSAIAELHSAGLVHGDLKLENAMFTNRRGEDIWEIKVIDFGLTQSLEEVRKHQGNQFGTVDYWAPELFVGLPLSEKIDVWAVGIMIFELFTGRRMFEEASKESVFANLGKIVGFPENSSLGVYFQDYFAPDADDSSSFTWRDDVYFNLDDCWYPWEGFGELHKIITPQPSHFEACDYLLTRDDVMFKDLLEKLLHPDAEHRISAKEALGHDFFQ